MDPVEDNIWKSARQRSPHVSVDDLMHFGRVLQSPEHVLDCREKIVPKPRLLLFVPAECLVDLVLHIRVEHQRKVHCCPRTCSLICSQVSTLSGLASSSASRRSSTCRCSW